MIIDPTYFNGGKLNLPQTGNTDGTVLVQGFIDDYEPEYLQAALGYDLWKAFTDGIAGSGTPDQRWVDLLEGKEFTRLGRMHNWPGFEVKPSPISGYVYTKLVESEATTLTLVGTATANTTNATRVNPTEKIVEAWNDMVKLNHLLAGFLNANATVYPEWVNKFHWQWWWASYGWGYWHSVNVDSVYKIKNRHGL